MEGVTLVVLAVGFAAEVVPAAVGFVVMVMAVVGRVVVEVVGGVVVGGAVTVVALVDELGTVLGAAVDEPSTQFTFAGYTGNCRTPQRLDTNKVHQKCAALNTLTRAHMPTVYILLPALSVNRMVTYEDTDGVVY